MEPDHYRATRIREAILAAARALLEESGPAAVTHQRVATRAGVGRATVYRHWPQPDQLLQDVLADARLPFFAHLDGPLRPWLCRELRRLADELALAGVARFAVTLIERAQWDDKTRARRDRLQDQIAARLARAFEAAAARGEAQPLIDPSEAAAVLLGPIYYRVIVQGRSIDTAVIQRLVAGVAPEPLPAGAHGAEADATPQPPGAP